MGFFTSAKVPKTTLDGRKLSEILRERGYLYQHTGEVEEITDGKKRTLYLGIDPTADSMHVGHLMAAARA